MASRPDAGVIERANRLSIPVHVLSGSQDDWLPQLLTQLSERNVDFIALAGFMKMIPSSLVAVFRHRIINIHPALLPDFGGKGMYGMNVHRAVIASGTKKTGATVHLVDEQYDTGPIVMQASVDVLPDDTAESLAARVLDVEHRLYPSALKSFAENRVNIDGSIVSIL